MSSFFSLLESLLANLHIVLGYYLFVLGWSPLLDKTNMFFKYKRKSKEMKRNEIK